MFHKVLAVIDRSPANKRVFEEALSLATADKANLILLHVLSGEEENSPIMSAYPIAGDHNDYYHYLHLDPALAQEANELYHRQWKAFETQGIKMLRYFANRAIAAGVTTEFSQITGSPSSTICEFAQSCHADVIIIGRRGYSGLKELFLGSVSNYVVHHAPCSVLLVRTPMEQKQQALSESLKSITYL